jgi:hypothetical protein
MFPSLSRCGLVIRLNSFRYGHRCGLNTSMKKKSEDFIWLMHEILWIWMYYTSSRMISQSFRMPRFIHLILLAEKTCLYVGNPSFISFTLTHLSSSLYFVFRLLLEQIYDWRTQAGDTLSSRHVSSRDVTSAVRIFNIEFWRILTILSLCLSHVIWRGALVGSHASTPLKFLLSHTFRETWHTSRHTILTSRELKWCYECSWDI